MSGAGAVESARETSLFREEALDRLASPAQLRTLMRVVDAKGWLALAGCLALLATAVVWGFLGTIPTRVRASGILIQSGGLADVVAVGSGQLASLLVDVGDRVEQGQIIAEVQQPELAEQLSGLRSRLAELEANHARSQRAGGLDARLRVQASARALENLKSAVAANEQRARELDQRLREQERAYAERLIARGEVEATRQSLHSTQVEVKTMQAAMQRFAVDDFAARRADDGLAMAEQLLIQDTERQLALLTDKLERNARIRSTHSGRVVEVRTMVGDLLQPGEVLVSLERTDGSGSLEALLYVDSLEGKRVTPGMEVQIEPSVTHKERHGFLLGKVKAVESYPSTRQGMLRVLKNEALVSAFLAETSGTPIAVRAELVRDALTPTGYRWSSLSGPELMLSSGTRCLGYVTTSRQRPIALVSPALAGSAD